MRHQDSNTPIQQYETWKTRYHSGQRVNKFESRYYHGLRGHIKEFLNRVSLWRALRHIDPGRRIMEVPCGSGRLMRHLISDGRQVIALDISREMLQKMQGRYGKSRNDRLVGAIQGDVERLPFLTGSCSCIVSFRFMQAVESAHRITILQEMRRVCDGPLVVQYQSSFALKHFSRWLRGKRRKKNRIDNNILNFEAENAGLRVYRIQKKFWLFSEDVLVIFLPK